MTNLFLCLLFVHSFGWSGVDEPCMLTFLDNNAKNFENLKL